MKTSLFLELLQRKKNKNMNTFNLFLKLMQILFHFSDSGDHKPRPPSGRPSSKKLRKQRLLAPQTSEKYEECREKAER